MSDSIERTDHVAAPILPRVFIRESGWSIAQKTGSDRVFCHQMRPEEQGYHRLADGELFVRHGDERLCLPCAHRRGLLRFEPVPLKSPLFPLVSNAADANAADDYTLAASAFDSDDGD